MFSIEIRQFKDNMKVIWLEIIDSMKLRKGKNFGKLVTQLSKRSVH
jgi:hypothetical protein